MKELKYTENLLEHTWETETENPAQGISAATRDCTQQVIQTAQLKAALQQPNAVALSCHMKADISPTLSHVRVSPTTKDIKKARLPKEIKGP